MNGGFIINYYNEIKNELLNNEINKKVKNYFINRSDLNTYYNVGKMLIEKVATVSQQLSYGHYIELLPFDNLNQIKYYVKIVEEQSLSIRQLREKIKSKEYERLPEDA